KGIRSARQHRRERRVEREAHDSILPCSDIVDRRATRGDRPTALVPSNDMSDPPVLFVEDDPNDIRLMRGAWARVGVLNPLHIARDGEEAVRYLSGKGRFADRAAYPMPCLLLVDLKLPKMSGFEVLKWLRTQPELETVKVIVLSSSKQPPDIG